LPFLSYSNSPRRTFLFRRSSEKKWSAPLILPSGAFSGICPLSRRTRARSPGSRRRTSEVLGHDARVVVRPGNRVDAPTSLSNPSYSYVLSLIESMSPEPFTTYRRFAISFPS